MEFLHVIDTSTAAARRDARSAAVGVGAGLVTSHTSGTPGSLIEIDPFLTRLRRLRRSVLTAVRMHEFELLHKRHRPAMLTLTYREVRGWKLIHFTKPKLLVVDELGYDDLLGLRTRPTRRNCTTSSRPKSGESTS